MTVWTFLAASIMALSSVVGVTATLLSLPGIWLIVATAGAIDLWRPETFSTTTLVIAVSVALMAELVEFVAAGAGAKKAGGARRSVLGAIVGALVGAVVGTPIMPIVGTIVGGAIGAGVGAAALERTARGRNWIDVWRVGRGAATGRLIATIVKVIFSVALAVYLVGAAAL